MNNKDLVSPQNSSDKLASLSLPEATLTLFPSANGLLPTIAFSSGEPSHTETAHTVMLKVAPFPAEWIPLRFLLDAPAYKNPVIPTCQQAGGEPRPCGLRLGGGGTAQCVSHIDGIDFLLRQSKPAQQITRHKITEFISRLSFLCHRLPRT